MPRAVAATQRLDLAAHKPIVSRRRFNEAQAALPARARAA
jgi:hypothetical protein